MRLLPSLQACQTYCSEPFYFVAGHSEQVCLRPLPLVRIHRKEVEVRDMRTEPRFAFHSSSIDSPRIQASAPCRIHHNGRVRLKSEARVNRRAHRVREQRIRPISAEPPANFPPVTDSFDFIGE